MNPENELKLLNHLRSIEHGFVYLSVYYYVKKYHAGIENVVTLEYLFHYFRPFEGFGVLKSRDDMRKICSEILPLCSCSKGVYYPMTKEDVEVFVNWMKPRAFAIFNRIKRIKEAHEEIYPNGHQFQLWEKYEQT